ncbi:PTS ascorbate transporter subunit IIB [Tatumella sp. JGM100]|uniref:PTS ascorbate transporter subunit IIB n=1 Tax=Tatumella punctata TaxID=399969 RepID=A0ABW1VQ49_9GAMM|nr:PTS ascorbate transporter subunit IIB [Tatumella sp. JGM16]MBS0878120.1 PTS ascorbate transporter subunit IIB [Tatumella sp. JGM82]MBS0890479.1 PTS ascorbate transporter subunit IIB [Tatumella sp. JGM94]MBS0895170.1 PTS ascorbate transporter subunit IIB [Tatumella sp. JGM130]MBS0900935.1 PTS ascorbate transporter subunit IIB [Tatumella sp. JGM100]MBS0913040.1 PTS ascorbate transporter subunit IIB [Tatumella sp. JGM91]
MNKALIVCGNGPGSSFIVEMNVKKSCERQTDRQMSATQMSALQKAKWLILSSAQKILPAISVAILQRSSG